MSLKSFVVGTLLLAGSLSSEAQQKVQYTSEADLFHLFLLNIESSKLPSTKFVGINGPDNMPYDCKPYDFVVPSGDITLFYCPEYNNTQVIVEYPIDIKEKQKNALRTELYTLFGMDTIPPSALKVYDN